MGKEEGEEKGKELDEDRKVKTGDGEDVLQSEAAEFVAKEPIFDFSGGEGGEEGGGAGQVKFRVEKGAEVFFGLVAEMSEAKGVGNGSPLGGFEEEIVRAPLTKCAGELVVLCGGGWRFCF
jgi:hypothetical protein